MKYLLNQKPESSNNVFLFGTPEGPHAAETQDNAPEAMSIAPSDKEIMAAADDTLSFVDELPQEVQTRVITRFKKECGLDGETIDPVGHLASFNEANEEG